MAKQTPIDASRARWKVIAQESAALDREREILERVLTEYETLATEFGGRIPASTSSPQRRRPSVPTVARDILNKKGHPLTARELVARLAERGKVIGGKDKVTNLSSTLSPHDDFVSIPWGGARAWWLTDREIPPEPARSSGKADQEASAEPQPLFEEGDHGVT